MKKTIGYLVTLGVVCCMNVSVCSAASGIAVEYRSQSDIVQFIQKHSFDKDKATTYSTSPDFEGKTQIGAMSDESLQSSLNVLNTVRYIAGVNSDVKLNSTYSRRVQSASYVMGLNKALSHYPDMPAGVSEGVYKDAKVGAKKSNIAWASWQNSMALSIIDSWMYDSDEKNISMVGHRRWLLNPTMKETGFGAVYKKDAGAYSAVYVVDHFGDKTEVSGVAWPAQNMPIEYFKNDQAWSLSVGKELKASKIKVVLTRKSDNKTWKFSKGSSDGYFKVNNDGCGVKGCVIFRPDSIEYKTGDEFNVKITGAGKEKVDYDVKFFSIASVCGHSNSTTPSIKKASFKKNGKITFHCNECNKDIQTTIYKIKTVELKEETVKYNAKKQQPVVVVKDSEGNLISSKNYSVKVNKAPKKRGQYTVNVKFKGNYTGKKKLVFTIK